MTICKDTKHVHEGHEERLDASTFLAKRDRLLAEEIKVVPGQGNVLTVNCP